MSIFSAMVHAIEGGEPINTAVGTAVTQVESWGQGLVASAEANPSYGAVVTTAVNDAKIAINDAGQWANTAIAGALGNFGDELADLITKYAPTVLGGALAASGPGGTLLSALVDVGTAVLQHEVLAVQGVATTTITPTAPATTPQS